METLQTESLHLETFPTDRLRLAKLQTETLHPETFPTDRLHLATMQTEMQTLPKGLKQTLPKGLKQKQSQQQVWRQTLPTEGNQKKSKQRTLMQATALARASRAKNLLATTWLGSSLRAVLGPRRPPPIARC